MASRTASGSGSRRGRSLRPRTKAGRNKTGKGGTRSSRKTRLHRWIRAARRAPGVMQLLILVAVAACTWSVSNWVYQVVRKPSELLFPLGDSMNKAPAETWAAYAPLFRRYSTAVVSPDLLAALAQTEGAGNPVARTFWRWSWRFQPFEVYRPASSSVGLYQMTDGTFAEARRYCISHHRALQDGVAGEHACWFNGLYMRILPSHAVELTSAYLDRHVAQALAHHGMGAASAEQTRHLAAVIHLCGAGAGDAYARRGFHFAAGERCGDHDPRAYLARVDSLAREFRRLDSEP